jgi:type I restriction enzyme S subunit
MNLPEVELHPEELRIVRELLRLHLPDCEVWAFGSRARQTAKNYSDLDLAILGQTPLPLSTLAELANDFSESNLRFKVDLVDWATTSESFRRIIEAERIVLQNPRQSSQRHGVGSV